MRKLTVTVRPNALMKRMLSPIFSRFEAIELKELMRMDFQKGTKIGVGEVLVKPGVTLGREVIARRLEVLHILGRHGDRYVCLMKVNVPKAGMKLLRLFDFDLIYDIPTRVTLDRLTYSVIGKESNLRKFLKVMKLLGTVEKVSYRQADYRGVGVSGILTEKQKNIIEQAMKWGYYRYPRGIDTTELAARVGVSRTTLVEHLRKAENRVMEQVFSD